MMGIHVQDSLKVMFSIRGFECIAWVNRGFFTRGGEVQRVCGWKMDGRGFFLRVFESIAVVVVVVAFGRIRLDEVGLD